MGFKKIERVDVIPPARKRPKRHVEAEAGEGEILLTYVANICVADIALFEATAIAVLTNKGFTPEEIDKALHPSPDTVDLGECMKAMMVEAIAAIVKLTNVKVGSIETYQEIPG